MNDQTITTETDDAEPELSEEEYDAKRAALQDQYRFFIANPAHTKGVEYSLWIREDEFEYPILSSNTGGFVSLSSRHTTVGDGLELTEEFFTLLGLGVHESMCFIPHIYFRDDHFERTYTSIYDDKPRKHEVWVAQFLIHHFVTGDDSTPELRPLAEWAGVHTKFDVPILTTDSDGDSE